jgi:hypothetical protein
MRQGRVVQILVARRKELHLYPKITKPSYDNVRAITLAESQQSRKSGTSRLRLVVRTLTLHVVHARAISDYSATIVAEGYLDGLIDSKLYERIDEIRLERNTIIHKFWLLQRRGDKRLMRKKLEKLARTANSLVTNFDRLAKKIGVDIIYDITV